MNMAPFLAGDTYAGSDGRVPPPAASRSPHHTSVGDRDSVGSFRQVPSLLHATATPWLRSGSCVRARVLSLVYMGVFSFFGVDTRWWSRKRCCWGRRSLQTRWFFANRRVSAVISRSWFRKKISSPRENGSRASYALLSTSSYTRYTTRRHIFTPIFSRVSIIPHA